MRERIYRMIKKAEPGERVSKIYNIFIVAISFLSITPLMFKESSPILDYIDIITLYILFTDYIFRWITYDYASGEKGVWAFVKYPFTPLAILEFVSLLPSMDLISQSFKILRIFKLFKVLRYSRAFQHIVKLFKRERKPLVIVLVIVIFYIFTSALALFVYEPDMFTSFLDAFYWVTTALTSARRNGLPATAEGRLINIISALVGLMVVSLTTGTFTTGLLALLRQQNDGVAEEEVRAEKIPLPSIDVKRYAAFMLAGVFMDFFFSMVADNSNLPLWLDVTGTAFVAMTLGPAEGLIVGLANNFYLAVFQYGAGSLIFFAISVSVALITGVFLKKDGKIRRNRIIPAILLAIAISSVLSCTIDWWITRGGAPSANWERFFYDSAIASGASHIASCLWAGFVVKLFDTIVSAAIVALMYALYTLLKKRRPAVVR